MERITYYDIDFGSYFIKEEKTEYKLSELYIKLINKIGELEDRIEELENGLNKETRGRIENCSPEISEP